MARTTVQFKMFRGTFASWNTLFTRAAEFASTLAPEKLITISHSGEHARGVVTVWYRE